MNNEFVGLIIVGSAIGLLLLGLLYEFVALPIQQRIANHKTIMGKHKYIAINGGAFDPITRAHVIIAKKVNRHTGMPVWMMPCYGHMFGKEMADSHDRLKMVELSTKRYPNIMTCHYEVVTKHTGSMYDTLKDLSYTFPETTFHLVIGMDNANNIDKWANWEKLISEFPCIVFEREGVTPNVQWFLKPPHRVIRLNIEMSSTVVRNAIKCHRNKEAQWLVPSKAWNYIKSKGLYGYEEVT